MKPSNELNIDDETIKMEDSLTELVVCTNDAQCACYQISICIEEQYGTIEYIEEQYGTNSPIYKSWKAVNELINTFEILRTQSTPSLEKLIKESPPPNHQSYI